jgi:hypothetical protein
MNVGGMEISTREAVLAGAVVTLAVVSGIVWLARSVAGDAEDKPAAIMAGLETSARVYETTSKKVRALQKQMGLGKYQIPSTEDSSKVLSHIDKSARAGGLGFESLSATAPAKGKRFQSISYRFSPTGELKSLVKFVDQIQSGEYLICLENWDLKPSDDPKKVKADLSLKAYFKPAPGKAKR